MKLIYASFYFSPAVCVVGFYIVFLSRLDAFNISSQRLFYVYVEGKYLPTTTAYFYNFHPLEKRPTQFHFYCRFLEVVPSNRRKTHSRRLNMKQTERNFSGALTCIH